ncbi:beta-N-acetylhexosaminidase [Xylella fastidiosa]|uniref:beta-N-acetylhexosaminidase n=1 Tax=Xylella fastidiosa TaxID=2371 RepID=UPI003AFB8180
MPPTPARPTQALPLLRALLTLCIAALSTTSFDTTASHHKKSQHPLPPRTAPGPPLPPLPLIPAPVQIQRGQGHIHIGTDTLISIPPNDTDAQHSATYLATLLQHTRNLTLHIHTETTPTPDSIRLQRDPQSPVTQTEGYTLQALPNQGIHITARDGAGLFYGTITAWQLLTADSNQGPTEIPTVTIHDWPRFKWRGQLLDVARHFHDVDTVKHVIDAMAQHKLNVLHLHLTDDQGWRIEIKRYPKLTTIGAERIPPGAGRHGTPERYGGFYTQDQIRELVAYATERQITILPEIDMPGHAQAAVAAYPDIIGVTSTTPPVSVDWGVNPYLFDTATPSLDFIRNVLDEVLTLFPSQYIHIGGDEAVKDQWEASHTIRAQMRRLGVKDTHAMQGWFNTQLSQYLTTHGRRLIGWDEIIQSGLPDNAAVMSWRGVDGVITAAQQGHDVVLAPAGWMYLDNLQTERSDEPNGRLATLPLSRVYALDPIPKELTPDQAIHILGLQSALWSEYIPSRWHIDHALFPRLAAVAEVAWSPMTVRNWDNFLKRLPPQLHRYQALRIDYSDGAFAADIMLQHSSAYALAGKPPTVTLSNQTNTGHIHYTTNGNEPTLHSPRYTAPFPITLPTTVKAAVFTEDGRPLAATRSHTFDHNTLLSVDTQELRNCSDKGPLGLRVPLLPDMPDPNTPVYNVDLFHACWIVPQIRLNNIHAIHIDAARLARNYGLAHDQSKVIQYPKHTAHGELEIRTDCNKKPLAVIPLPPGDTIGEPFTLDTPLPPTIGVHDLCLRITAPIHGPLYAIGRVQLIHDTPASPPPPTH